MAASPVVALPPVERVVAVGDVHGSYDELLSVLQGTHLVDEHLHWSGTETHLVLTGDLLSRGPRARAVLDLLMRLEAEAAAAGGAVHVLIGNHEAMSLSGDLRYVSAEGFASFAQDDATDPQAEGRAARARAFASDGHYGRWLLSRPALLRIGTDLFVHGGLSPMLQGQSLELANATLREGLHAFVLAREQLLTAGVVAQDAPFRAALDTARRLADGGTDDPAIKAAAGRLLAATEGPAFQPDGPLWYRGSALCHPFTEAAELRAVLDGLGATRLVIGHTPTHDRRIHARMDGMVLRIDTGMNPASYAGRAAALLLEDGVARAWYAGEGSAPPVQEPARIWERPHGMDDAAIERFLVEANVVARAPLATGITRPERVTLEQDGRRLQAVFKSFDSDLGLQHARTRWSSQADHADRFLYDLAAYRLDRILGLGMVPVAVQRSIDGQPGVLQLWIEGTQTESERRAAGTPLGGHCDMQRQYALMNSFDVLVQNTDRNLGNLLYDEDWNLWLIDHSRAFGTGRARPAYLRNQPLARTPELSAALRRLDEASLEPLAELLHPRQLKALRQRAAQLAGD